jgi:hypothetical protein
MTKLVWGSTAPIDAGVKNVIYFSTDGRGFVWNGVQTISENTTDSEVTIYIDGQVATLYRTDQTLTLTLTALSYPMDVLRSTISLAYQNTWRGHRTLHLIPRVIFSKKQTDYTQRDPSIFTFDGVVDYTQYTSKMRSPRILIDLDALKPEVESTLLKCLYGSDTDNARFLDLDDVEEIFESHAILRVTDYGDGKFTISGPDSAVKMMNTTLFEVSWPSVKILSADSYTISSL